MGRARKMKAVPPAREVPPAPPGPVRWHAVCPGCGCGTGPAGHGSPEDCAAAQEPRRGPCCPRCLRDDRVSLQPAAHLERDEARPDQHRYVSDGPQPWCDRCCGWIAAGPLPEGG